MAGVESCQSSMAWKIANQLLKKDCSTVFCPMSRDPNRQIGVEILLPNGALEDQFF
jgi:hypothetical protein